MGPEIVEDGARAVTERRPATSCALVILSCDRYRDLWEPCLALYRRYWPDCPYPMFLVSETVGIEDERVRSLRAGAGLAWSDVVRVALGALDHEHVLLVLEDFLLTGPVPTVAVEAMRAELEVRRGAYMRLGPFPGPTGSMPGVRNFGEHLPGAPFRVSLQAAFWRRGVLLDLLEPGESPSDFEKHGSVRSVRIGAPFFAARRRVLPYLEVIKRGKWSPEGIALCRREGLPVDLTTRPRVGLRHQLRRLSWRLRLVATGPVSWRFRRKIRSLLGQ